MVPRPHLIERLNDGLERSLTLVSAPAGFGKTTLLSTWARGCDRQVAWLSLDDGDNDPTRFVSYVVAALRTISANVGESTLVALRSPQPPPTEAVVATLLNDLADNADSFVLVLDDYHLIDSRPVETTVAVLLEYLPPQMHLVIATREDPQLPLARLRARGQLSELRVKDLRFTPSEAAAFLEQAMGLDLSAEHLATLEARTEGWIAGLQLAALSLRGRADVDSFVESFSGSHHFVLDYLVEEVVQRQSDRVQAFLLRTSILAQLSGALCDAVLQEPAGSAQATLEELERANLFIVPLDDERRWYRYHNLFADLLRQRLQQSGGDYAQAVPELHARASQWYEEHGQEIEAFHHAAAANDIERAERLIEAGGVPLQFRGADAPVLKWLESLPQSALDARPALWVTYASALFFGGRHTAVEAKLQAAETALERIEPDDRTRDIVGRIAAIRATLAIIQHDGETITAESRRALEYLDPDNLPIRTSATYTLGYAQQLQGDRAAASRAYSDVIRSAASSGESIYTIAATLGLAQVQETETELFRASHSYERVLELVGDPPRGMAGEAHLGLARIYYEWNDLAAAEMHARQCAEVSRQMDSADTFVSYAVLVARLRLAAGDVPGAVAILDEAEAYARQHGFLFRAGDIVAARVLTLLRQGRLAAAAQLAHAHALPISQARVDLARGDANAALIVLEPWRRHVETVGWTDRRLEVLILQALALAAKGNNDDAAQRLLGALELAEPGGYMRSFVDEAVPMAVLLSSVAVATAMPQSTARLLSGFEHKSSRQGTSPLVEPLSQRELEVLRLIGQGLSNQEIGARLFLALDTVKGHNRRIFGKLQVERRTEAVARARELGLT
jgi:LuxR family transcriptional regulator, maltose regulon positive regulatory protein